MSPGESADQTLAHAAGRTAIYIGRGALERSTPALGRWLDGRLAFIITAQPVVDANPLLAPSVESLAGRAIRLVVPDGEAAKTLQASRDRIEEIAKQFEQMKAPGWVKQAREHLTRLDELLAKLKG